MARKAKENPRATLACFEEYDIGCGRNSSNKLTSKEITGIYARGSGTPSYVGAIKIFTETDVILISWEKKGRPHISVYEMKEDYGVGGLEPEYFTVVDKKGNINKKWNSEVYPGWEPAKPKVSTFKEKARGRRKKN